MDRMPTQHEIARTRPQWMPQLAAAMWRALQRRVAASCARRARRLRLRETLMLGDRRFLAVVECDGQEMIIGGSAHSITLLTRLSLPGDRTDGASRCAPQGAFE
jgi:flagellar biogenesis protein FliO